MIQALNLIVGFISSVYGICVNFCNALFSVLELVLSSVLTVLGMLGYLPVYISSAVLIAIAIYTVKFIVGR